MLVTRYRKGMLVETVIGEDGKAKVSNVKVAHFNEYEDGSEEIVHVEDW